MNFYKTMLYFAALLLFPLIHASTHKKREGRIAKIETKLLSPILTVPNVHTAAAQRSLPKITSYRRPLILGVQNFIYRIKAFGCLVIMHWLEAWLSGEDSWLASIVARLGSYVLVILEGAFMTTIERALIAKDQAFGTAKGKLAILLVMALPLLVAIFKNTFLALTGDPASFVLLCIVWTVVTVSFRAYLEYIRYDL